MAKYEKIRREMKKRRNMSFVELGRTCLNQGRKGQEEQIMELLHFSILKLKE